MDKVDKRRNASKRIAFLGLMLALIIAATYAEHALPAVPGLPPGVRLGLSNLIIMYGVYFLSYREAFLLAVLKSAFVLVTRGMTAGLLSVSGGVASLLLLILLARIFGDRLSYISVSVVSAAAHNMGQLAAAALIMQSASLVYYLPILLAFAVPVGIITGVTLRAIIPALKKIR